MSRNIIVPLITLIIFGAAIFFEFKGSFTQRGLDQTVNKEQKVEEKLPIVLYTEVEKQVNTQSRLWPTLDVMRRVGDTHPELLLTVGEVGEYPVRFMVSPDKKHLLINLEKRLLQFNLETGEVKTLFETSMTNIDLILYSPDQTELLVNNSVVTLATGEANYLPKINGTWKGVWRGDGKIVFADPGATEGWSYSYYDFAADETTHIPRGYNGFIESGALSPTGYFVTNVKHYIAHGFVPCTGTDFRGGQEMNIIHFVSNEVSFQVRPKDGAVKDVAYGPGDHELLYEVRQKNADDSCNGRYYILDTATGVSRSVSEEDINQILSDWEIEQKPDATIERIDDAESQYGYTKVLVIEGEQVLSSDKLESILGTWYQ